MKTVPFVLAGLAAAFLLGAGPASAASQATSSVHSDAVLVHTDFVDVDRNTINTSSDLYTEARYRGRSRGFRSRGVRSRGFNRSRGVSRGNSSYRNRGNYRGRFNDYYYDDDYYYDQRSSFRNSKRFKKRRLRNRHSRY